MYESISGEWNSQYQGPLVKGSLKNTPRFPLGSQRIRTGDKRGIPSCRSRGRGGVGWGAAGGHQNLEVSFAHNHSIRGVTIST